MWMVKERNYDFRKRLLKVHKPDRRDYNIEPGSNEIAIDDTWDIIIPKDASRVILNVARDLEDYLFISMGVAIRLRKSEDISRECYKGTNKVVLLTREDNRSLATGLDIPRSYRIICSDNRIILCGYDDRGTAQASYYLEDIMNFKCAPIVQEMDECRKPLFSPRMVHSGYGLDMYPDAHLNAIAHAGMDAILVFTEDVDITPKGYLDFNELIYRAQGYGIDVYAYSYLKSLKHPDDAGAEEYYDSTYGRVFKKCPELKGVVLVGESVEFPSKDPNTTGKLRQESAGDILPSRKPSPGWWPCRDYPQWLNVVKKSIRRYNPEADIVFWTYNWGYVDKEHRIELLRNIPTDVSLLVTFEMFEQIKTDNVTSTCVDYTLSFEGPGKYFTSEAEIAHERGIKLYTMCNTGGLTWDIGVIPYEPAPYQWIRRHEGLHNARERWNLTGLMESHHFGWWPSFVSEVAKWSYWDPSLSSHEVCKMIARRDFGQENEDLVIEAWKAWSEGIRNYVSTNEDQYGPFRIGPSYPLVFTQDVKIPAVPHAMFGGNKICHTNYGSKDNSRSSLFQFRLPVEISRLEKMQSHFEHGVICLEKAFENLPENKKQDAFYMINLGKFIVNCVKTTINVKKWHTLKMQLFIETNETKVVELVDRMIEIGKEEIENAKDTIPLVEADSRLGWEPSMEYMTDVYHLEWKISQVRYVIEEVLPAYKGGLKFNF